MPDYTYSEVCQEYRENPNPITKCGFIMNSHWERAMFWNNRLNVAWVLEEVYGEFYHIDPFSIRIRSPDPYYRHEIVFFKAKSRIRPHVDECLEYWIESLQGLN